MSRLSPITLLDYWFAGEDQGIDWPVYAPDDKTLVNISGWTIEFRMSLGKGGTSMLTKAASIPDPTAGLCRVFFSETDTAALAPRKYFYELWRLNAGFHQVIAHGDAHLQAMVV